MSDTDYDYDDFDNGECWNCGGEGRVAGVCIDGCCLEQDDPYCEYCSHRCEVCNANPKVVDTSDDLHQVLGEALNTTQGD